MASIGNTLMHLRVVEAIKWSFGEWSFLLVRYVCNLFIDVLSAKFGLNIAWSSLSNSYTIVCITVFHVSVSSIYDVISSSTIYHHYWSKEFTKLCLL